MELIQTNLEMELGQAVYNDIADYVNHFTAYKVSIEVVVGPHPMRHYLPTRFVYCASLFFIVACICDSTPIHAG